MDPNKYRKAFDELSFSADFEERTQDLLRRRARSLNPSKSSSEKENRPMNLKFFRKPLVFAAAAALLVVSVSAAALFLRPSEVAQHHNQPVLAQAFEDQNAIVVDQTVETGDFAVNLTGLVSGKNLTDWSQDVDTSHTYAVVALSRLIFAVDPTDGSISFAPDFAGPHALFTLPLDASKADPAAADEFAASTGLDFDYNAPIENAPMEPDDSDVTYRKEQTGDTTTIVIE